MPHPTRTLGPLHFEDLEPHRFEDLVRQLAYGFRTWRSLEATGRLGADEGTDIRGVALLRPSLDTLDEPPGEEGQDGGSPVLEEQEWRIQCKRYHKIGASLMRTIVRETVPDPSAPPYGLVVAAACDVSAQTMAAFRDEAHKHHVREACLWTKARLEDMLFRPEWDHLLFAYFGISLGTRRRAQLQEVRDRIALKRKLLRALEWDSIESGSPKGVLVRDILDDGYPNFKAVPGFRDMRTPPWHMGMVVQIDPHVLWVVRKVADGWVRPDGTWDLLEGSLQDCSYLGSWHEYWQDLQGEYLSSAAYEQFREVVPERERKTVQLWQALPLVNVLEVDPIGDLIHTGPHLYCRFINGEDGPYEDRRMCIAVNTYGPGTVLKGENRAPLLSPPLEADGVTMPDEPT